MKMPSLRSLSWLERREVLRALHVSLYILCRSVGSVMMGFGASKFAVLSWASHAGSRGGGSLSVRVGSMTSWVVFLNCFKHKRSLFLCFEKNGESPHLRCVG